MELLNKPFGCGRYWDRTSVGSVVPALHRVRDCARWPTDSGHAHPGQGGGAHDVENNPGLSVDFFIPSDAMWALPEVVDTGRRYQSSGSREFFGHGLGVRVTAGTSGYNVFISYSHALDGAHAPALQTGLERFAKPCLGSTAGTASLPGYCEPVRQPRLVGLIEQALASSTRLVLMASPAWVSDQSCCLHL